jgi:hypothetical protein
MKTVLSSLYLFILFFFLRAGMVIIIDFKENIKLPVGNSVTQQMEFEKTQITCLGFFIAYRDENNKLCNKHYYALSTGLSHDADFVAYALEQVFPPCYNLLIIIFSFFKNRSSETKQNTLFLRIMRAIFMVANYLPICSHLIPP